MCFDPNLKGNSLRLALLASLSGCAVAFLILIARAALGW